MKLDPELADIKSRLSVSLPKCDAHRDSFAIAFCGHCGKPICESCLAVTPVEPRCEKCMPVAGQLPSMGAWLAGFLGSLVRQRWALSLAGATALFVVLLLFLPGLLRARPPAPPVGGGFGSTPLNAPWIEKAFRLRTAGDLYTAGNSTDKAQELYRRALAACRTHLESEKRTPVRLQVQLAMALLEMKSGSADNSVETCRKVITDSAGGPAAGVAYFYMGQAYELALKNPAKALENYRAALKYAQSANADPTRGIEKLLEYDDDKGAGGRTLYGIAGLTATHTSAEAVHGDIVEAIRRITGKEPDESEGGLLAASVIQNDEPPQAEAQDPLVIVRGK